MTSYSDFSVHFRPNFGLSSEYAPVSTANSVFYLSILHLTASHAENFGQSQRKNYSALHSLVFLTVEMTK
jgi:hypothetical protein